MSDTTLVRIKVDDKKLIPPGSFLFTTKLSSFAKVIHLPVDYIKFDGSLIQGLLNNDRAEQVVSKMNEMAKALNIRTVAEFVDSRELLTAVRRIHIDYTQGFLIGKPAARLAKTVELRE